MPRGSKLQALRVGLIEWKLVERRALTRHCKEYDGDVVIQFYTITTLPTEDHMISTRPLHDAFRGALWFRNSRVQQDLQT